MTEPAQKAPDVLESDVDAAIALCDGDVRAALRAALIYIQFLDGEIEAVRAMVSTGYTRGKISPSRVASKKLDEWREMFSGANPNEKP
jgi:hypothetical protein